MSHSKGFLSGTCPGNYRNYGRSVPDGDHMKQQQKCGRCGKVRWKRVRKCLLFHHYVNKGEASHGYQKQKCDKCGWGNSARVTGCGILRSCSWHQCDKIVGLHCRRCGRGRG